MDARVEIAEDDNGSFAFVRKRKLAQGSVEVGAFNFWSVWVGGRGVCDDNSDGKRSAQFDYKVAGGVGNDVSNVFFEVVGNDYCDASMFSLGSGVLTCEEPCVGGFYFSSVVFVACFSEGAKGDRVFGHPGGNFISFCWAVDALCV